MKGDTISRAEFAQLKAGDLIVWRGKRLRTVEKGPVDYGGYMSVQLPISLMSWTKRIYTIYGYNDLRKIVRVADKRSRLLMQKSEWLTLESAGFDVRAELRRELKEAESLAQRMGRSMCKNYPRLKTIIEAL